MDAAEFKRVFMPCHRKLYAVAYRIMGDAAFAEDMVQDTYVKLWERRDSLGKIANPDAYCLTVLRNVCFDECRRSCHGSDSLDAVTEIADPAMVVDSVEERDALHHLSLLIRRLPANQATVVRLRDLCGCSFEEIGRATGFNEVNIRVLLSRARKKLREQFKNIIDYGCR